MTRSDFSLLNHTKITDLDNMLVSVYSYQFWYTHSTKNWLKVAPPMRAWIEIGIVLYLKKA